MRINRDGSIPSDNPFYNDASGAMRAIYALGLRNPYSVSNLSPKGQIYINDAVGPDKGSVYRLTPGANYGHDGYDGIGTETDLWANMSVSDALVITGGLWYPSVGYWPSMYHGNYFAAFWGSNSNNAPGAITRAVSEIDNTKSMFYDNILLPGGLKPVMLKLGPDGDIYYMMTDHETGVGDIYKIVYTGELRAKAPIFTPEAGQYPDSIYVAMSSESSNTDIYFTMDNSQPDSTSSLYVSPILVDTAITINAIAYEVGKSPSAVSNATYSIGAINNLPPIANAGPDLIVARGREITLNGSDSFDPDGSPLEIQEHWEQIGGSPVAILDADETVANFTPMDSGLYVFKIVVEDIYGEKDSDNVIITVLPFIDDYFDILIARWSLEEGADAVAEDTSPNSYTGETMNTSWSMETGERSHFSLRFDNANDRVEIEDLDVTG
jgi:hypothetical protein